MALRGKDSHSLLIEIQPMFEFVTLFISGYWSYITSCVIVDLNVVDISLCLAILLLDTTYTTKHHEWRLVTIGGIL